MAKTYVENTDPNDVARWTVIEDNEPQVEPWDTVEYNLYHQLMIDNQELPEDEAFDLVEQQTIVK